MMARTPAGPGLSHLRVTFSDDFYIGPGRADLLEGIAETGSISAAGKVMVMSYKRAWTLVQALNDGWGTPLVETSRGGAAQGGATLTADGRLVLLPSASLSFLLFCFALSLQFGLVA